jgi:hypothetical protein
MPINQLKFIKNFLDKYSKEYSDLPTDIIGDIIITVLIDAPESYFSYDMVQEHPEFCKKCGACCKQREQPCEYFNGRTCDDYYARWDVCAEFPYYEINGDEGLMLDPGCQFALKLAEMQIEKEIKREYDFLLGDNHESE